MSETPDVGEKLRPLEEGIGQQQIAIAMMHVSPIVRRGTILPSTEHKMMDHNGEPCLAIAVEGEGEIGQFKLSYLRGERGWPGYSYLGFHVQDDLLYVGVPMSIVNDDDEDLVSMAMEEFEDYDKGYYSKQGQGADEEIVAALLRDFQSKSLEINLHEGGDAVDK